MIAEWVETEKQMRRLLAKDCDELQGFMFGRPMPARDFDLLLDVGGSRSTRIT